jgi:MFS superfamily sulfate permease-like transporter
MPNWLFASLRGYRIGALPGDLVAGIMLAAIALPGQLATARLADMPPQTGIYAFVAGSLAFAAFGGNRFMSVAADSTIAPIFAGGLAAIAGAGAAGYQGLAALLAVMIGLVLVAVGLLRAGWLANLLSVPITTGFLAGISVHIVAGALPTLFGISDVPGHLVARLVSALGRVGEADPATLSLGLGVLAATIGAAWLGPRVPGALVGLVLSGLAVAHFDLGAHGVALLGAVAVPLPRPAVPALPDLVTLGHMVQLALVVAMVCIMQTAAVASAFPSEEGEPDDARRDFAGVGAGSIVAGLVGSFAVDASPPSTAIVRGSGGRSQLASLTAIAVIVAVAWLAARLLAYLPQAALAGILLYLAFRIFRGDEMIRIWRHGRFEIALVAASAALVVALPIDTGMLLAIVLSFVYSLFVIARPLCVELARVPGTTVWWPASPGLEGEHEAGVLVFAPAAPINFTNAEHICARIRSAIAARPEPVELLVIEANGVIDIDYTGSRILGRTIAQLQAANVTVALARLSETRAQAQARRIGLVAAIGAERVFLSVEDAVRQLRPRATSSAA